MISFILDSVISTIFDCVIVGNTSINEGFHHETCPQSKMSQAKGQKRKCRI